MKFFIKYIRSHLKHYVVFGVFFFIYFTLFLLYKVEIELVFYATFLCIFVGILISVGDMYFQYKNEIYLETMLYQIDNHLEKFKSFNGLRDKWYQEMITQLFEFTQKQGLAYKKDKDDMLDYYTLWVHQIKTPIAAMNLYLQNSTSDEASILSNELLKIEGYVEMVLSYLRLNSDYSDYHFQSYSLDSIIKESIHKYAPLFIQKNLSLEYTSFDYEVITDEKWFSFVLDQVLTNAIKYTNKGGVKIYLENDDLVIEDSGIGIAKDQLSRIFEKGFTGINGRYDKKASGLGLSLCKQVLTKLSHTIHIDSVEEMGTTVIIGLKRDEIGIE